MEVRGPFIDGFEIIGQGSDCFNKIERFVSFNSALTSPPISAPMHASPVSYQSFERFDKGPVNPVNSVIESTGIAQIMTSSISPPQWS